MWLITTSLIIGSAMDIFDVLTQVVEKGRYHLPTIQEWDKTDEASVTKALAMFPKALKVAKESMTPT